jgi:hypothetical protein
MGADARETGDVAGAVRNRRDLFVTEGRGAMEVIARVLVDLVLAHARRR